MNEEWQPFRISEQDEAYEQFLRGLPFAPEPPEPSALHGLFNAYRSPGLGSPGLGRQASVPPHSSGPECDCLTTEEHLSACRKAP